MTHYFQRNRDARTAEEQAVHKERVTHIWRVFIAVMVSASTLITSVLCWAFFAKIKETVQTEMAPIVARQEVEARAAEARLKAYLEVARYERETALSEGRVRKVEESSAQNRELIRDNYVKILEQLRALDVKISDSLMRPGRANGSGGGGEGD